MIKMILATDEKGGIGKEGKLPWHMPEDLRYFKEITHKQVVVMGRKTFDSLPFNGGLPHRYNYVITNKGCGIQSNNCVYLPTSTIKSCIESRNSIFNYLPTWVIGGASIYEQLFPYVEEIHHSCVKGIYECDTFMDTSLWVDSPDWRLCETKVLCDDATVNIWRKYE